MRRVIFLLFSVCFILNKAEAQIIIKTDTVSYSLSDAENLFIKSNFDLLAAKYQIDEAEASLIQAKLWDNPNINLELGAYNEDTKKWFEMSQNGESAVILQQLIYLAGKRNKRINIEKIYFQRNWIIYPVV